MHSIIRSTAFFKESLHVVTGTKNGEQDQGHSSGKGAVVQLLQTTAKHHIRISQKGKAVVHNTDSDDIELHVHSTLLNNLQPFKWTYLVQIRPSTSLGISMMGDVTMESKNGLGFGSWSCVNKIFLATYGCMFGDFHFIQITIRVST